MTDADFIVCGAGPAGSTAARYLSGQGHRVILIDRDNFPRDKPCGGGLCPHILDFDYVRETLDDYLETICYRGIIYSPSMKRYIDHRSDTPLFYNIRRKKFDHQLVKFAIEKGAEFRKGVVKAVEENNSEARVTLADGNVLTAEAVIGATGPYDLTGKYIREKNGFPPAYQENEIGTILVNEFEVGKEFIDDVYGSERTALIHLQTAGLLRGGYGYGWVFSKSSVLNIGYGGFKKDMKKIDARQTFLDYLEVLKRDGFVPENLTLKSYRGAPLPLSGNVKITYHNRLLIAGDAAGFVSPISGEGIYFAMDSGRIASEVLNDAYRAKDFSVKRLSQYQKKWYRAWGRDLRVLRFFANRLMAWPERLIGYGQRDEVLRRYLVDIFISTRSAYDLKYKVALRVLRNFFHP